MPKFSPSTPRGSSTSHRFETREDAQREDRTRARLLRKAAAIIRVSGNLLVLSGARKLAAAFAQERGNV